jgi:HAE1 family hydrophobic/amphiphilic exporter-1
MSRKKLKGKISLLPRLSLTRPVTVLMSLVAVLVVGYIAKQSIPVELMPAGFTPPFLGVWTPYPNANPKEVEQLIARPMEEVVRTIKGVETVQTNSQTNGCWTFLSFNQDTDMDLAYSQLQDRIDRVKPDLPDDVERLYIRKWSDDDDPIMWIAIIPDIKLEDPYYFTENLLKKPLERIDGVANVEIWGADEKSIQIFIKQDVVKAFKLNLYEIVQTLRSDNFAVSSGNIKDGGQKIYVRSVGKFRNLEQIKNIPIHGSNIRLKDVADVVYDVPERTWVQRIDGKSAIQIGIFKESMANTVELCEAVEEKFTTELMKDPRLANFKVDILFNQGTFIKESTDNLQSAAIWGGIFAFFVLYFFLRRLRMTIMLNLSIPLSLVVSLTVMYFMGWTLNLITMMGLMISVGMVVDNSIVVLENIYRRRSMGDDNLHAAANGTSEVALAIIMATFTTIVVFLPLILMSGDAGFKFYMFRIGMPVIIALLASLIVAMVFIPLAATRIVSKRKVEEPKIISSINSKYGKFLGWTLKHRLETFIVLIFLMFSQNFIQVASTDDMDGNINDFRLFLELPDNYTLNDAERVVLMIEDTIRTKADRYGLKTIDSRFRHNMARLNVFLHPEASLAWYDVLINSAAELIGVADTTLMSREQALEDVKKRIPELPGVTLRTTWRRSGDDDASVSISLYGDDTEKLTELSKEVERRLNSIPEILSVEADTEEGEDEIQLVIKREEVQKYGINPRTISGTIMYALRGIQLPKYQTDDREINMLIQLQKEDRETLQQLKNITFFSSNGREVPLESVASIFVQKGMGRIHRENGKTYLAVKANTTAADIGKIHQKIDIAMAGFEMPYGYSWTKGDRFARMQESDDSQFFAIILSIVFVLLLMGILFESFVLPWSVIISVPFSFIGAKWMLYLTDTPMDLMSRIGYIILIGIVVNNAIVLIDLVNRLRVEGFSRMDALLSAGKQRFRPIMMTAFTTIGGLIPMALGNTKMIGISYKPLGITIIGGMIFSTMVSLVAVPWAYMLFDDLRNYFKRVLGGILLKKEAKQEEILQTQS